MSSLWPFRFVLFESLVVILAGKTSACHEQHEEHEVVKEHPREAPVYPIYQITGWLAGLRATESHADQAVESAPQTRPNR